MSRQNLVRVVCERCDEEEEFTQNLFHRYPKGWSKAEGVLLCPHCYIEFRKFFRRFLDGKSKS